MKDEDRKLGMDSAISRRDFINGATVSVAAAGALSIGGGALAQTASAGPPSPDTYPPLRSGYRGDYTNIYAPAHNLRDGGTAPEGVDTGEIYDLVVVGGGLSGLSAAWYYREAAGTKAKILILENHDDFGGHAKRNEFVFNGGMYVSPGGSNRLPSYDTWAWEATRLLRHLQVDPTDPRDKTDTALYRSLGMGPATFFSKEAYGKDLLLKGGTPMRPTQEWLAKAPLSPTVKADLWKLTSDPKVDYMAGMSIEDKVAKLQTISYRDYLLNYVKLSPEILPYTGGVWAVSNETSSAWYALFRHKPGFAGLGIAASEASPESHKREVTNYYIPGGNHSVCRLILRDLIPGSLPPGDFISVETERFDYSTLDRPGQPTRVRLNSTVVRAKHVGPSPRLFDEDKREVEVTYVQPDGKALKVRAKDVVMAGNNNMIPYICPELPEAQRAALRDVVRCINVQINVLLRDWKAFAKLGVSSVAFPNAFINSISLDQPRTFGKLATWTDPSQPVMTGFNITNGVGNETFIREITNGALPGMGNTMIQEARISRMGLYNTPFERFEKAVRSQAQAALGAGGFDAKRDIVGITINRWGHGYALPANTLFDDPNIPPAFMRGRAPFGRIAIANSDSSGIDTIETAFNEAARAVRELERHEGGRNAVI
jgi:spermidine dehydrogenase